jgi:DNA-binding protein HU-beta
VNKSELIDAVADRVGVDRKTVTNAVDAFLDTVTRNVAKGERVVLTGFGSFEKKDKPARMVRNPATGQSQRAKKTSVPRFKAGAAFKDVVSGAKKLERLPAVKKAADTAAAGVRGARRVASDAKATGDSATSRRAGAAAKTTAAKAPASRDTATKATGTKATAGTSTSARTASKSTATKAPAPAATKSTAVKAPPAPRAAKAAPATKTATKTAAKTTTRKTAAKKS